MGRTVTDVPPRNKKLDRRYLDHLAGILRPIVRDQFDDNATAFAKHVGISQPQIAQLLRTDSGDRGVGIVVLMQLRKFLQMSIDDMLGLPPVTPKPVPKEELVAAVMEALDRRRDVPSFGASPPTPPSAPAKRKKPE
jgi:hypothetical protein